MCLLPYLATTGEQPCADTVLRVTGPRPQPLRSQGSGSGVTAPARYSHHEPPRAISGSSRSTPALADRTRREAALATVRASGRRRARQGYRAVPAVPAHLSHRRGGSDPLHLQSGAEGQGLAQPGPLHPQGSLRAVDGPGVPPELRGLPLFLEGFGRGTLTVRREPVDGETWKRTSPRCSAIRPRAWVQIRNAEAGLLHRPRRARRVPARARRRGAQTARSDSTRARTRASDTRARRRRGPGDRMPRARPGSAAGGRRRRRNPRCCGVEPPSARADLAEQHVAARVDDHRRAVVPPSRTARLRLSNGTA